MYCVQDSFASCFCDVCCVEYIVDRRWEELPPIDTVRCTCRYLALFFMYDDFLPGGASGRKLST